MSKSCSVVNLTNDDDDEDELVSVGGVLDRLHRYAYAPIPEEDSVRVRCRYSKHVGMLCDYIAAREKLRSTRVYPAIVVIGYGMRLHSLKEKGDLIYDISNRLNELRSSDDYNERSIANHVQDVTLLFPGDRRSYRLDKTIVAQINECAKTCGALPSNMYLYYFLIGIRELVESEESFSQVKDFKEYKRLMMDFEDVNDDLKLYMSLIAPKEVC